MSTRATIAVRRADGAYDAAYLHYDGYPGYAGAILQSHYRSPAQAQALVAGGEIRMLHQENGVPAYFDDGVRPVRVHSHEALVDAAKQTWSQYLYVFDGGIWSCVEI